MSSLDIVDVLESEFLILRREYSLGVFDMIGGAAMAFGLSVM